MLSDISNENGEQRSLDLVQVVKNMFDDASTDGYFLDYDMNNKEEESELPMEECVDISLLLMLSDGETFALEGVEENGKEAKADVDILLEDGDGVILGDEDEDKMTVGFDLDDEYETYIKKMLDESTDDSFLEYTTDILNEEE